MKTGTQLILEDENGENDNFEEKEVREEEFVNNDLSM
jgi:hypothetical protein